MKLTSERIVTSGGEGFVFPQACMDLGNIIFVSGHRLFPMGQGGGEISAYELLSQLSRYGCQPTALGVTDPCEVVSLNAALKHYGASLSVLTTENRIVNFCKEVYTFCEKTVCSYCLQYPCRVTTLDHLVALFRETLRQEHFRWLFLQTTPWPVAGPVIHTAKEGGTCPIFYARRPQALEDFPSTEEVPLVFCNSRAARDQIRKRYGIESEVLYPGIDLERYRTDTNTHEFITMINPMRSKGVLLFLRVAECLPHRRFLVVENRGDVPGIFSLIQRLPNVTYLEKQLDMRRVYSRTHLLLVPSQWQEPFGRVIVEAQGNGIPVCASSIGGIPEALGTGGILVRDFQEPAAWLQAIAEAEDRYAELSILGRKNAERFAIDKAACKFAAALERMLAVQDG